MSRIPYPDRIPAGDLPIALNTLGETAPSTLKTNTLEDAHAL